MNDTMTISDFLSKLHTDFYTGVPDSKLKALCNYLIDEYGIGNHHIIAANEGNATGLAAGYYLATGKVPVVYLQNSGIGNIVNPVCSLLNEKVYGIPCIFIVGWRGEPGIHDEPQHIFQGEVSEKLLHDIGLFTVVLSHDDANEQCMEHLAEIKKHLKEGKSVAFLVREKALAYDGKPEYKNEYSMNREEALRSIMRTSGNDILISTTGKTSRELFEIRERNGEGHERDFLTVGSMGHASSIALGIALHKPERRIWCVDGDGAVLMHMGAMATIGSLRPKNLVHVLINNEAHESVGGMPTAAGSIDFCKIADGCGYPIARRAVKEEELQAALAEIETDRKLSFLEVRCAIGSREGLGRPTTTPEENRKGLMHALMLK